MAAAAEDCLARPGRVLVISPRESYRIAPYVQASQLLGRGVAVVSEGQPSLVGPGIEGIRARFDQPDEVLDKLTLSHARMPFAAIIGTDDLTTELAAVVARRFGLRHNDPAGVRIARRKDLARACLAAAGIPVPWHRPLDLRLPLTPQLAGLRYPCVAKPVSLSASKGVIRADDEAALRAAIGRITAITRELDHDDERTTILVEEYLPGAEVAVEGLLDDGAFQLLALFDKPDPLTGPFFEETYYVTPSRLPGEVQAGILRVVAQACAAYGLREGPVHAECRVNAAGVWILEVAARTIGGLCGRLLKFGTGLALEELVLRHALALPIFHTSGQGAAGVLMIPIPEAGILRRVEGVLAAGRVPHIEDVVIDQREGSELIPLPEGSSYLGFIFARAPTAEAAEAALRAAHACLRVVVAPLWRLVRSPEGPADTERRPSILGT